jgi:hypothetical protein
MAWIVPFIPAIVGAVGAISQGNAQAESAEFNARVSQQNAARADAQAKENARRQRALNQRDIGSLIAERGASGLQTFEGNALDIINDSLVQGELLAQDIEASGKVTAQDFRTQAALGRASGSGAQTAGILSAGGSLLKQAPAFGKALSTA